MMQYSNSGMALLGLIVQRMNGAGLEYGEYVEKHIIEPLGMSSTRSPDGRYDDPDEVPLDLQQRVSTGYSGWGELNVPTAKVYLRTFPPVWFSASLAITSGLCSHT